MYGVQIGDVRFSHRQNYTAIFVIGGPFNVEFPEAVSSYALIVVQYNGTVEVMKSVFHDAWLERPLAR